MMRRRLTQILVYSSLLHAFSASAQFEPAPNLVLPNYDRTLIGEVPALEAGAFVARVSDSSANWYNPAGLALRKRTSINASSSAYQWTSINAEGPGGGSIGQTNSGAVPGFFGIVLGEPIFATDRVRVGFAMSRELEWEPRLQEQISSSQSGAANRIGYAVTDSFNITLPSFAIAFAPSDSFRIGLGAGISSTSYLGTGSLSNQQLGTSSQANQIDATQIDANTLGILFSAGVQYDVSEHWRIGVHLRAPSIRLWGSGQVNYENLTTSGGQTTDTNFYDGSATFRYEIPFQTVLGLAYIANRFEIEGDLRYHAATGPYAILSSNEAVVTNTSTGGGAPTTTSQSFADVENSFRNVTDYAIGARYRLTDHVDLHSGFYTSYSPVKDASNIVFRKLDMYGATFGASINLGYFSGSLGSAYEFGTSDVFGLPNAITGVSTDTKVRVNSLKVLYALTFAF